MNDLFETSPVVMEAMIRACKLEDVEQQITSKTYV